MITKYPFLKIFLAEYHILTNETFDTHNSISISSPQNRNSPLRTQSVSIPHQRQIPSINLFRFHLRFRAQRWTLYRSQRTPIHPDISSGNCFRKKSICEHWKLTLFSWLLEKCSSWKNKKFMKDFMKLVQEESHSLALLS
jgi:hypothetical protein